MEIEDCIEPGNIIWEGLTITGPRFYLIAFLYLGIITILLLIAFCSVVYL